MTMMPYATRITHPAWCQTDHAGDCPTDPAHLGPAEPMLLAEDDWEISVQLLRTDEVAPGRPQERGTTGALLTLTSFAFAMDDAGERLLQAAPYLTPTDMRRLAGLLTVFADAADNEAADARQ